MTLSLIISPVRSWPLDQGNRARILTLGTQLKARGHKVHFLLSELEGRPSDDDIRMMEGQWDLLCRVPYRHQRQQRYADAWGGDDWYDPALDQTIRQLTQVWRYDLCLVNYAWYSRALEALPESVVRIIDTHDAFGDRHKRLYAAGTTPAWYYTRAQDEGRCLDRADIVLSIQEEEQAWFESLSQRPVRTVGHIVAPLFLPPRERGKSKLRAGYLASSNPSNQQSIAALVQHWARDPFLSEHVELHVAGPICKAMGPAPRFVTKHGFVPDIQRFYAGTDFSVNPNIGGSGLKIKSVEALSYGQPLFATTDGMLGICGPHPPYVANDVATMVTNMSRTLAADATLQTARSWARGLFMQYRQRNIEALESILSTAARLRGPEHLKSGI